MRKRLVLSILFLPAATLSLHLKVLAYKSNSTTSSTKLPGDIFSISHLNSTERIAQNQDDDFEDVYELLRNDNGEDLQNSDCNLPPPPPPPPPPCTGYGCPTTFDDLNKVNIKADLNPADEASVTSSEDLEEGNISVNNLLANTTGILIIKEGNDQRAERINFNSY